MRTKLISVATALALASCGPDAAPHEPASPGAAAPASPAAPANPTAPAAGTAASGLPVLGEVTRFRFTDQAGNPFGLGDIADCAWVGSFAVTRAPAAESEVIRRVARLQQDYEHHARRQQIRFVSFAADPESETANGLRTFALGKGADLGWWSFLIGPRNELRDLCAGGFGMKVDASAAAGAPVVGTSNVILVDTFSRVRGRYDGTQDSEITRLRADLNAVLLEKRRVMARNDIADPPWVDARQGAQLATRTDFGVYTDFTFTDRLPESGIKYVGRSTPDGMQAYTLDHYDHGNGVSVADVDGDGLPDLFFPNQVGGNQLWRNVGGGRFEDITDAAGIRMRTSITVAGTFADFDNDGDPDLYVTCTRSGNRLFANDGKGHFTDVTDASGLGYAGHSSVGVPLDWDGDGKLDLFLANIGVFTSETVAKLSREPGEEDLTYHVGLKDAITGHIKPERTENSVLFRNLGGLKFEDATAATGLVDGSWTGDAAVLDANGDGRPDLYVLNMQGHDEYWENDGGKRFVRKSLEIFPNTPWGSMGFKVFDWDGDLDLDLFVTDMHSDMSEDIGPELEKAKSRAMPKEPESIIRSEGRSIYGNALYRNDGKDTYAEISDAVNAENYWPWGPSVGDLNADGFQDVFIASSMNFMYRYGVNTVLLNDQGKRFRDAEYIVGVEPRRGRRTVKPWFDLDFEGLDRGRRFAMGAVGQVQMWDPVGSRAAACFDLDGDGDLDIVTNDYASEPMVLISDLAQRKPDLSYLRVVLVGSKSNRDGIGAQVTVRAGGKAQVQQLDGKSGYLAYSTLPLYFGLGSAARAESVHVVWPSGTVQDVTAGIEHNGTLVIREP